jgi:hypothetical protein
MRFDKKVTPKPIKWIVRLKHMRHSYGSQKKTPLEWQILSHIEILDPDGWDRENLRESMAEPLTFPEFELKMCYSTCRFDVKLIDKYNK